MKFVYFDIGNIFHTTEKVFCQAAKDFNLSQNDFGNIFDKYEAEITCGDLNVSQFWQLCCRDLKINHGENYDFPKSWVSDYTIIPVMHELATKISQKYSVGILSNHYFGNYQEMYSQKMIPQLNYSAIIISAEVGCQKPDPRIYEIAQQRCGYSGNDILFVDDKQENLDTATKFGWQVFLFDYHNPQSSANTLQKLLTI